MFSTLISTNFQPFILTWATQWVPVNKGEIYGDDSGLVMDTRISGGFWSEFLLLQ